MEVHGNEYHDPDFATEASLSSHAAAATGVHGVGASTIESIAGSQAKVDAHKDLATGVHGVGSNYLALAPAASHLVRAFTKGWTADKFLKGAGVGADPTEVSLGKTFTPIATTVVYYMGSQSQTPRTATVQSVSSDVITLTAAVAYKFGSPNMDNTAYLKIANTTKVPVEYAWVKTRPAANQLQVTSAAAIATWTNGDTITTAYDGVTSEFIELDISPTIPANATCVLGGGYAQMAEAVDSVDGFFVAEAPDMAKANAIRPQVNSLRIEMYPSVPIVTSQRLFVRDRGTTNNVFSTGYWIVGYFA
jgi:hypothetical protein